MLKRRYSQNTITSTIKGMFSKEYLKLVGRRKQVTESRKRKGEVYMAAEVLGTSDPR